MALTRKQQAEYQHWEPDMTLVIDDKPVRFRDVCVHTMNIADVEDPDLFMADPTRKWQQSEAGQFIMENSANKPYWIRHVDHNTWGHQYKIMARLSEQHETFWRLKWGNK